MKKLLLGLVATTALIATPALAADLPPARQPNYYKAPPLPPVFSWTGCYVGADIGGGFVRDADNEHTAAGGTSPFSPAPTNIANSSGVMGGGFVGCNYQFSNGLVVGAEGDGQLAGIGGGTAQFPNSAPPGLANTFMRHDPTRKGRCAVASAMGSIACLCTPPAARRLGSLPSTTFKALAQPPELSTIRHPRLPAGPPAAVWNTPSATT